MLHLPKFKSFNVRMATADTYRPVKERAFTDFEFFVKTFFYGEGNHVWGEFSEMHRDFCIAEHDPDRRGVNEVVAAPRGNAKTTFRVLIKALHAIVYGYHPFILIIGYSQSEAIDKVKDIRDELLTNEKLIKVYGKLIDSQAAKSDFITRNGVRVTARSRGGQVRGLKHGASRPSLILLDDIESLDSVNTPEQREKTAQWFYKDVMGCGRPDGKTDVTVVGTVLHQEALLSKLLNSPGWARSKYQAVKSWPTRQALWDQWQAIYCDLNNPASKEDARSFYEANEAEMLEGVEVLWPSGEPFYKLMEFKIQFGLAALYSEKQNDPYDPDRQILNPDACERFKVILPASDAWPAQFNRDRFGFAIKTASKEIHSRDLKVIAFHDPALAETNKSDYASICVCAQDLDGYVYVLESYIKRDHPSKQIQKAFDLKKKWQYETLYLETVGFQELLKPLYRQEEEKQGLKLNIIGVDQHQNKVHRIGAMEPHFSNGWIKFNESIDPLLIDQLRLFPTTHDDGPDALHGCVSRLKKPFGNVSMTREGALIR